MLVKMHIQGVWAALLSLLLLVTGSVRGQQGHQVWVNPDTMIYQDLQQITDPLIFMLRPVFEGHWSKRGTSSSQFGEFDKDEGWARCQFSYVGKDNWKFFFLEIVNGVGLVDIKEYMDNLKYSMSFNLSTVNFSSLTDNTVFFDNFDTSAGKEVEMVRINYLSPTSERISVRSGVTIKFLDKTTGKAFDLDSQTTDFRVA